MYLIDAEELIKKLSTKKLYNAAVNKAIIEAEQTEIIKCSECRYGHYNNHGLYECLDHGGRHEAHYYCAGGAKE